MAWSSLAFGDIDNDGDLDLVLTGCNHIDQTSCDSYVSKIYTNNGTSLNENQTWQQNLTAVNRGSLAFGDIDNDGDLDLVLTGCSNGGGNSICNSRNAFVYTNNGTSLNENQTWQQNLTPVAWSSLAFGDIDNDGDLDLVLTGSAENSKIAKIYTNNGTSLNENQSWQQVLQEVYRCSLAFGDIDNDGDLDLALTGSDGSIRYANIYINNGTSLIENSAWSQDLLASEWTSVSFGDYNNDGNLDFTLIGHTTQDNHRIYKNNGTTFIEIENESVSGGKLFGIFDGSLAWGDYDNDGDLDLITTGHETHTVFYRNNNNDNFTDFSEDQESQVLDLELGGSIVWIDIDNDDNLDTALTGFDVSVGRQALIYTNNITTPNTQPNPPAGAANFSASYSNGILTLSWGNGSDAETPMAGLYYNLRAGTSPGSHGIVSGVYGGGDDNGYFGNMMQRKSIALRVSLQPNQTIYWAVQTIDTGLAKSAWGTEQNYTYDITDPIISLNSPSNSSYRKTGTIIDLSVTDDTTDTVFYSINNYATNTTLTGPYDIDTTGWSEGETLLDVWANDSNGNMAEKRYNLTFDDTPIGKVNYVAPTPDNDSSQSNTNIYVNATLSESSNSCLLEWNDGTLNNETMAKAGSGPNSVCYRNMTGLMVYNYSFRVYANDTAGNWNSSELRTAEISTGAPAVEIISPGDNTWNNTNNVTLAYSVTGSNLDSCSLYLNMSGWAMNQTNTSPVSGSQGSFNIGLPDRDYIWNIVCNNTGGSSSWYPSNLTLHIDTTAPAVALASPGNRTYSQGPELNFSCSETNPDSCWYWNGTGNTTLASCDTNGTSVSGSEGQNILILYMNDSAGNAGSDSLYWSLDTIKPQITLISPGNASSWTSSSTVTFQYNVSDTEIANCSLIMDGSLDQTDSSVTLNSTQEFSKSLGNGNHAWRINCTDLGGLENSSLAWNLTVSYRPPGQDTGNGGGVSGTITPTTQVTYAWDKIEAGGSGTAAISMEGLDITGITVQVKEQVTAPRIMVQKLDARPSELPAPAGISYQYIKITPTKLEEPNIKSAAIRFRVANGWMTANNIDEDSIALNRYADGEWTKLPTRKVESDTLTGGVTGAVVASEVGCGLPCQLGRLLGSVTGFLVSGDYAYYEANATGFSYFVITGEAREGVTPIPIPPEPALICNNNSICEPGEAGCPDCMAYELNCTPGYRACSGNLLLECDASGSGWLIAKNCSYICANGRCWPGPGEMPEPEPGDYAIWIIIIALVCLAAGAFLGRFYKQA